MLKELESHTGFNFQKTRFADSHYDEVDFGCNTYQSSPKTPDRRNPDVVIVREVHNNGRLTAPDGQKLRFWGFRDPKSTNAYDRTEPFPSPAMRVRSGQIVHTQVKVTKGPHTIHHHGIEPTTMNDGVGHVSFEVQSSYTYQWQPSHAGTFFYHCHRNTPLHFEMGMFGLLIVDPVEGPGYLHSARYGRPAPRYDPAVETIWVADDMDLDWHSRLADLGHDAGMCGNDVGLHKFAPKYFLLAAQVGPKPRTKHPPFSGADINNKPGKVVANVGQPILIRLTNASYSVLRVTLGINATVHVVDGHELFRPWNQPYDIPAYTPFELTSAQRLDMIITPTRRGKYPATLEFLDWVTLAVQDRGRGVIKTEMEIL